LANYFSFPHLSSQSKSSFICKALLKYGYSGFSLEVLEYCEKNEALEREQFYLDSFKPEYNILQTAGSLLGYKHTDEAKGKIIAFLTGGKASEATKAKQREAKLGLARSEATRAKLKEHLTYLNKTVHAKKKGMKVIITDLETNVTTEYDSVRKAAEGIGSYLHGILRHEKLQLKGYTKPFKGRYVIKILR
jgi:group I intron endonuclease